MSKSTPIFSRKIVWHARVVMAQRKVKSVSALARDLAKIGIKISVSQLGRLIDGHAGHWNQEVIEGMMHLLDCELSDLVRTEFNKEEAPARPQAPELEPAAPVPARRRPPKTKMGDRKEKE